MIIRRRKRRTVPGLNTASLPDLIFTVLFFFMIVTHMRNVTPQVRYTVPKGSNLTQMEKKAAIIYIYIGKESTSVNDNDNNGSDNYFVQVNDKIVDISQLKDVIIGERNKLLPDELPQMTVSIKADRNCPMGIINDVKQQLRQANALRINYNATQEKEEK